VVDLYLVCEPLLGRREIFVKDNHNRLNWAETIRFVAEEPHPQAERMTVVCDNLTAHKPSALYELLPPERARRKMRRGELVHTPKHGSWLNVAENELSVLKRVGIAKRVGSQEQLKQQIAEYQERRNKREVKVEGQFTTKDARVKLKRLYPPLKP
jgi:transposase